MLHLFEASFNYSTAKTLCNGQSSRKVAVTVLERIIELYNFFFDEGLTLETSAL